MQDTKIFLKAKFMAEWMMEWSDDRFYTLFNINKIDFNDWQ